RRKQGLPQPMISYFAPIPWLARALVDLHSEYGLLMRLDQAVADVVALVVSQENSCRYCYAGVRALLWFQGMSRRGPRGTPPLLPGGPQQSRAAQPQPASSSERGGGAARW